MANKQVKNVTIKVMPNAEKTLVVNWSFSEDNLDHFEYQWFYGVGSGITIPSDIQTTTLKTITWQAPDNAKRCYIKIKPVGTKKAKWTGAWYKTETILLTFMYEPEVPSAPDVTIDNNYLLTASLSITDKNTTHAIFRIVYETTTGWKEYKKTGLLKVSYNEVKYKQTVKPGSNYRVQCRAYNSEFEEYSEWGEFSGDNKTGAGGVPSGSLSVTALSSTSVQLKWSAAAGADEYEVEYVNREYDFDTTSGTNKQSGFTGTTANIYGLTSGQDYYFRVRGKANNVASGSDGYGGWSNIAHIVLGKKPTSPTTWSNTTVAMINESLVLYWIHNSSDGSKQRAAQIELTVNGSTSIITPSVEVPGEEDVEKTYSYTISSGTYGDGVIITWRVRTKGILDEYSDWSVLRTIKIYASPTIRLSINGLISSDNGYTLSTYPFSVDVSVGPSSQKALGYQVEIISLSQYTLFDQSGLIKRIRENDIVMSDYISASGNSQTLTITPESAILENTMVYRFKVTVAMDSGLSAEDYFDFEVSYVEVDDYNLEAYIVVDTDTATCQIKPGCYRTSDGSVYPNVHLSVIRREYDGSLTKIIGGLNNEDQAYIIDPHPALDYARYRIVAVFMDTGQIDFFDPSDEYIGIKDIIINWDEMREGFPVDSNDEYLIDPRWVGGMIRLPYNIDIDDTMKPDVELVDYIGREHSVAYYGTKKSHDSKWSVTVAKTDEDTIRILRTIGAWRDNVYVREPSGTGYWATIEVNISQKHNEPGVPVSLNITRVEGGI